MATHNKRQSAPAKYFIIALLTFDGYALFIKNLRAERHLAIIPGKGMNLLEVQQMVERDIPPGSSKPQIAK